MDAMSEQISFRPMVRSDIALLKSWMAEPHVYQWWKGDYDETIAGISARTTAGPPPGEVDPWLMEIDAEPIGVIQWYRAGDDPTWFPGVEIPLHTVAIDIAIGDPAFVDRGFGRRLILEFVHHVLRAAAPSAPEVWIDPDPMNERAIRCYRAAGFVDTGLDLPDPEHPGDLRRLMRMRWAGPTFH